MDVDKALNQIQFPCHHCHQPGHLACNCPHAFDIWTMMSEERLGFLPELLTLTKATEILSPSIDLERPTKGSLDEVLTAEELGEVNFGTCSG